MNCIICKKGQIKPVLINLVHETEDNRIVVLNNVPAHVCQNCGYRYFDSAVTEAIQKRVRDIKPETRELEFVELETA